MSNRRKKSQAQLLPHPLTARPRPPNPDHILGTRRGLTLLGKTVCSTRSMKKPTEFDFASAATDANTPAVRKAAKPARKRRKLASAARRKRRPRASRKLRRASGIRETEEARALLEKQLHSLYWWVFNACKMRGFIRAKALEKLERVGETDSETHTEQDGSGRAHISTKKQAP